MIQLGDFFSPEAGQARTRWLNDKLQGAYDAAEYYLGPTGIPQRVMAMGHALNFTDAGDMPEAARASRELWNDPSLEAAADYLGAGIALGVPVLTARMINDGVDVLGSAVDDVMAGYDPARVNIFAGVNAKTADLDALERAKGMADSGAARGDIWRDTGWFQGVDGKWRFEIDDMRSRLRNRTDETAVKKRDGLGASFQHDALFEAYPELADMPLSVDYAGAGRRSGFYTDIDSGIGISPFTLRNRDDARSTLLHELQHGVQDAEGFARGGNVNMAREIANDDLWGAAFAAQDRLDSAVSGLPPEYKRQWEMYTQLGGDQKWEMQDRMMKNEVLAPVLDLEWETQRLGEVAQDGVDASAAFDTYRRLSGEVEARNVEARRDLTPTRRGEPWTTQEIPDERQIVRFRSGSSESTDPSKIRSRFARFDPRLAHLRNFNAGLAGIMMGGMALSPSDEAELETYLGGI